MMPPDRDEQRRDHVDLAVHEVRDRADDGGGHDGGERRRRRTALVHVGEGDEQGHHEDAAADAERARQQSARRTDECEPHPRRSRGRRGERGGRSHPTYCTGGRLRGAIGSAAHAGVHAGRPACAPAPTSSTGRAGSSARLAEQVGGRTHLGCRDRARAAHHARGEHEEHAEHGAGRVHDEVARVGDAIGGEQLRRARCAVVNAKPATSASGQRRRRMSSAASMPTGTNRAMLNTISAR